MQSALNHATIWAQATEQEYHVTQSTSVARCLAGNWPAVAATNLVLGGSHIKRALEHKWLGGLWQEGLQLNADLENRQRATRAHFVDISSRVNMKWHPIACNGALLHAPFLPCMVPDAGHRTNSFRKQLAREIFGAPAFIRTAQLLAKLRWHPWWIDLPRVSIKRQAAARSGCRRPWLIKLYAGERNELAGEQLPITLRRCAETAGLPTGEVFHGVARADPDRLRAYDSALKMATEGAWAR